MRVMVTGGAGFIGSHVVDALLARGDAVVVLDNVDDFYDPEIKRMNIARWGGRAVFVEGDICDRAKVELGLEALGENGAVVHLAAKAGVRPSVENPVVYTRVNVEGTTMLLDAARRCGVSKFIFASSSSVYGARSNPPFREDDRIDRPISPYAATKAAGELLCSTFNHLYGLQTVALRFFTVYGPRQRPDLAIAKFSRRLLRNEEITLMGDLTSARDYTYVDDTVRGILSALARDWPTFDVINLGGAHPVQLGALLTALEHSTGRTAKRTHLGAQAGDVPLTCAATHKAEDRLGWKATVDLPTGLRRYVDWLNTPDGAPFLR
ncbi:MAG: GDP-mannose 4,6-dehydratase [Archangium sp.]|nr:GDP-mannose 4,6-dehydratase [Archangium sp.]